MARDSQRLADVLLDEEDRQAFGVDLAQLAKDVLHDDRRQPHRRLVEQQQAGPCEQRATDREHLLLAAGEVAGQPVDALGEPRKEREHTLQIARDPGAVAAPIGAELEVLAHRERRQDRPALGDLDQAALDDLMRLQFCQFDALEAY